MYDEKPNWNKSLTRGNRSILELRISCAQLKTERIHDSNVHTNANVWSNLISNLESKAKVITFGRIWYGGLILVVVNKNSNSNTRVPKIPKFHQHLSDINMHLFGIQR
jgi:hypothetical protein